MNLSTANSNSM